jgi:hypothetical protein
MSVAGGPIDGWLAELGLVPLARSERDGIVSWDLVLDGRLRLDVRMTLILDPVLVLIALVHYAPALTDAFRASYRTFLRWNDELPLVKFALSEDDRPVLATELPVEALDRDALGRTIVRLLAVCDLLLADSVQWLWPGRRGPPPQERPSRHEHLFARFAADIPELLAASGRVVPGHDEALHSRP